MRLAWLKRRREELQDLREGEGVVEQLARALVRQRNGEAGRPTASGVLREPSRWSPQSPASLAMGYEISVTPLQLAVAYATFANGGELVEPALVKEIRAPDGTTLYLAKEDSVILSLLRRLIGPLMGILRTNFIIVRGDSEDVVGEFNRKFTILDRYVLDLKADRNRLFDRRVALALGVMLDTGERR